MAPDLDPEYKPLMHKGKRGYMARGIGWAVGPYPTKDEALARFRERQAIYREIDERYEQRAATKDD